MRRIKVLVTVDVDTEDYSDPVSHALEAIQDAVDGWADDCKLVDVDYAGEVAPKC